MTVTFEGNVGSVEASVGAVACFPHRTQHTCGQFIAAADKAMYSSKTSGKNRVTMASLLAEEDRRLVEAVRKLLFSVQLHERGGVNYAEIKEATRLVAGGSSCLGRLARKQGWISNGELAHVLLEQRRTRKLFGEVAIAKGYLTQAQVYALLAIQKEHPEGLAEALVDLGVLTEEDAKRELSDYYQSIQALRSQGRQSGRQKTGKGSWSLLRVGDFLDAHGKVDRPRPQPRRAPDGLLAP